MEALRGISRPYASRCLRVGSLRQSGWAWDVSGDSQQGGIPSSVTERPRVERMTNFLLSGPPASRWGPMWCERLF